MGRGYLHRVAMLLEWSRLKVKSPLVVALVALGISDRRLSEVIKTGRYFKLKVNILVNLSNRIKSLRYEVILST